MPHGIFLRNLRRATRFAFRGKRHRHASAGYEPAAYPSGRRVPRQRQRNPWKEFLLRSLPAPVLLGLVYIATTSSIPHLWADLAGLVAVFVGFVALIVGISAPWSRPRSVLSWLTSVLNFGALTFVLFGDALEIGWGR